VFVGKRHLDDRGLLRRYLAERGLAVLDAADEPLLRHMAQCQSCEGRYQAMHATLETSRHAIVEAADEAFPPERLAQQRERILRHLDAQLNGPRILPFPAASATAGLSRYRQQMVLRWVAAAAVAGLIIGLTAGRMLYLGELPTPTQNAPRRAATVEVSNARSTPVMQAVQQRRMVSDDEFLSEVEMALTAPQTAELRALDAFTLASRDLTRTAKQ